LSHTSEPILERKCPVLRLALNHDPPNLSLQVARIIGMSHQPLANMNFYNQKIYTSIVALEIREMLSHEKE
jgi:hypothetical protein